MRHNVSKNEGTFLTKPSSLWVRNWGAFDRKAKRMIFLTFVRLKGREVTDCQSNVTKEASGYDRQCVTLRMQDITKLVGCSAAIVINTSSLDLREHEVFC